MSDCCAPNANDDKQRHLLWIVLVLNALMFLVEFTAGWLARSSGLMADSLDMLADALVYGLSLYAVGRGISAKAKAALVNGGFQLALGIGVLIHVGWRMLDQTPPIAETMRWIALLALLVNAACFALLYQFRSGDINLRASWICSRNDMLANTGVLIAAGLVGWLNTPWPDWIIALLVAGIVISSALRIIRDARTSLATGETVVTSCCASSSPSKEASGGSSTGCCGTQGH
ncbi:MAG: cation transporter [Oceanobacter sp.]